MIFRLIMSGFFSLTAVTLVGYQLVHVGHAFMDFFHKSS